MRENRNAYQRIWFRPRILRDVTNIDFASTILGQKTSLPIYITATALGKLGHPDGEKNLTWAAAEQDVIQVLMLGTPFPCHGLLTNTETAPL